MDFLQLLFVVLYLGTPLFILFCGIRFTDGRSVRNLWPVLTALGLWLLQAGVLFYFVVWVCISGHCRLTPLEEHGPVVLMLGAYIAIAWLLWIAWRRSVALANR